jgi:retinol dehydrogenase-12
MQNIFHQNKNIFFAGIGFFSLYLMRKYFNGPKSKYQRNLKGKIIIVTGASDGIGKETALQLLKEDATVIFACRDEKKTLEVISKIKNEDERRRAIFLKLDLSDFESIKKFIQEFKAKFEKLDILINNAGAIYKNFSKTKNGIESTLQVNTFGPMLLTQGLLNLLENNNSRVINVSSAIYKNMIESSLYTGITDLEKYDFNEKSYSSIKQYGLSKLGNIFFTQYLNKYANDHGKNFKSAALHPGVIITEIGREYSDGIFRFVKYFFYPLFWLITKTVRMGAETTLNLCYLRDEEFKSGAYYSDSNVQTLLPHAQDEKNMEEFMQFSKNIIKLYDN